MSVYVSQTKGRVKKSRWLFAFERECGCTEWRDLQDKSLHGEGPRCAGHRLDGVWIDVWDESSSPDAPKEKL